MTVDIHDESGADVDTDRLAALSRFVLDRLRVHPLAELSVVAVDETTMAAHHVQWMDEEGPTDVMAFPMDELRPGRDGEDPPAGLLGDVVLCPQVADRQAKEAGHSREDELHLLAVHGLLHLLGYDHADPEEHREMFALQARLLGEWQPLRHRSGQ
jgi:probable rRNA maturation factor